MISLCKTGTWWYKELLGLCGATSYRILNGRVAGDLTREYTCLANHSHSIVDV